MQKNHDVTKIHTLAIQFGGGEENAKAAVALYLALPQATNFVFSGDFSLYLDEFSIFAEEIKKRKVAFDYFYGEVQVNIHKFILADVLLKLYGMAKKKEDCLVMMPDDEKSALWQAVFVSPMEKDSFSEPEEQHEGLLEFEENGVCHLLATGKVIGDYGISHYEGIPVQDFLETIAA